MNLRLTGPCQPLGEGGQSSAYIIRARLSALGAHTCILRCFGKALAACGAMRARMARSRSALCGTPRLHCADPHSNQARLPGGRASSLLGVGGS